MGKKLSYEEVKSFIEGKEGNGCKLLSTEYKDNTTKLNIMCSCGEIFEASLNQFKEQNKRQCNKNKVFILITNGIIDIRGDFNA